MVDWNGVEQYEKDLLSYFLCCPICGNTQMTPRLVPGGRDTISCDSCGAVWHVHIGITGFKWAELDLISKDGKGHELAGKRFKGAEIRRIVQRARMAGQNSNINLETVTREKEIIMSKEIIIKIRCPYCKSLYDETLGKCPKCGANA